MTDKNSEDQSSLPNKKTIPVVKEQLSVGKKEIERKVVLKKEIIEEEVKYDIDLQTKKIDVERIPMNVEVDEIPTMRKEGNKTIVPVIKEVMVKKIMLVEEVHLVQSTEHKTETVSDTLRGEKITIHREPDGSEH